MKSLWSIAMLVIAAPALARDPSWNTAGNYEAARGAIETRLWISAAGNAFVLANAWSVREGGVPLFCAPQNLTLNEQNYISIFEKALPRAKKIFGERYPSLPWEAILMDGLRTTFPCKQ